jgi:hypothetical protein
MSAIPLSPRRDALFESERRFAIPDSVVICAERIGLSIAFYPGSLDAESRPRDWQANCACR